MLGDGDAGREGDGRVVRLPVGVLVLVGEYDVLDVALAPPPPADGVAE